MCTEVYFQSEKIIAGCVGVLAQILGGRDKFVMEEDSCTVDELEDMECLCHVDIEKTLAPTDYVISRWEHGHDWTARKPDWLLDLERRERDKARYEAAMAETRAAQGIETRSAIDAKRRGPKGESPVLEEDAPDSDPSNHSSSSRG